MSAKKEEYCILREAQKEDIVQLLDLFQQTLREINSKDYTPEQIQAWGKRADRARWQTLFNSDLTFIIAENDKKQIIGFTSISPTGYLHSMFVHALHQRKGVATRLLEEAERLAEKNQVVKITSEVSITAYPYFQKKGYQLVKEQIIELSGVKMRNYLMEKSLL